MHMFCVLEHEAKFVVAVIVETLCQATRTLFLLARRTDSGTKSRRPGFSTYLGVGVNWRLKVRSESSHRHADFQSRVGSPEALYFKELPGRPLPFLQHNA